MRKDSESRRTEIGQAALKIVGESGVKGLTTAAIAKEVGISEAALYRHFKNKDDILSEMIDQIGVGLKEKITSVMKSEIPCFEKLKANYLLNLEHIEKNIGIPRLIFSDQIHIDNESLRQKLLDNINGHLKSLEIMIEVCQKNGDVRADVDPKGASVVLLGMIQTLAMRWSLNNFSFSLSDAGRHLWEDYEKYLKSGS